MYFIVFLLPTRKNIVVPYSWIDAVHLHIEHFVNYGVNSNIKIKVFWTNKSEAFDANGTPRIDYEPNFNAGSSNIFPNEGWYFGLLRKFKCKNLLKDL